MSDPALVALTLGGIIAYSVVAMVVAAYVDALGYPRNSHFNGDDGSLTGWMWPIALPFLCIYLFGVWLSERTWTPSRFRSRLFERFKARRLGVPKARVV